VSCADVDGGFMNNGSGSETVMVLNGVRVGGEMG
jgi:hypothetical protein